MASFKQRQIVEVNFRLPGNILKKHPVVIVSNDEAINLEGCFVGVMMSGSSTIDQFSFKVDDEMLSRPTKKKSQIRCHLIAFIPPSDVTVPHISEMKKDYFKKLVDKIHKDVLTCP